MRSSILFSVLAATSLVTAQTLPSAPKKTNSPIGAEYVATLEASDNKPVSGSVTAKAVSSGIKFDIAVAGFPDVGAPFSYHIHEAPVPEDGNCTKALAHLDPTGRGETPACDASAPETCQVGDLAGKYGKFNGTSFTKEFVDPYVSLKVGDDAFFGNRSIVFHYANKTRIACANFNLVNAGSNSSYPVATGTGAYGTAAPSGTGASGHGNSTATGTGPFVTSPAPTQPESPEKTSSDSGAATMFASTGVLMVALVAALL